MAKWFHPDPEFSQITPEDKAKRDRIVAILAAHTIDMSQDSWYGSVYGVGQDDYEDVAEEIMKEFGL